MRTPRYGTQKTCRKRIDYTVNEQTQSNKLQIYFSSSMKEFLGLRMSQKNIFRAGKDTVGGFFVFSIVQTNKSVTQTTNNTSMSMSELGN